jgi:hypothetical protein
MEFRASGYTAAARQFPLSDAAKEWLARFNGVAVERMPAAWHYAPNEYMRAEMESRAAALDERNNPRYRTRTAQRMMEMPHLFAGEPDDRQSESAEASMSRFRPRYRKLTDAEVALHDELKTKATELEALFDNVAPGRYRSLAYTALEEAVMWAVKQLTA